jgi:hypothetical protein
MGRIQTASVGIGVLVVGMGVGTGSVVVTAAPAAAANTPGDAVSWGNTTWTQLVGAPGNWCMGTDRGPWVRFLQNLLAVNDLLDVQDIDGVFGPKTENALGKLTNGQHRCLDQPGWNNLFYQVDCRIDEPGSGGCNRTVWKGDQPYRSPEWGYESWWYRGTYWEPFNGGEWSWKAIEMKANYCTLAVSPYFGDIQPECWTFRDYKSYEWVELGHYY